MITLPYTPKLEETIKDLGQRALDLQARMRTLMWATLPLGIVFVGVFLLNASLHQGTNNVEFILMGLAALPAIGAMVMMVVAQGRLSKAFKGLHYTSSPSLDDVRQFAPPSAIGPLLEGTLAAATITSAWDHRAIDSATALLNALLQSVRPEDQVVLTSDQRQRLQDLVLPGRGDSMLKGAGGVGGKSTVALQNLRNALCTAAVGALGVLGDLSSIPLLERFAGQTRDGDLKQSALRSVEQIRARQQ